MINDKPYDQLDEIEKTVRDHAKIYRKSCVHNFSQNHLKQSSYTIVVDNEQKTLEIFFKPKVKQLIA